MPAPTLARPAVASSSRIATALLRLAAALLYACSLMLIRLDLPTAVFALLASLLCLPGSRDALRERTGHRVGGMVTASGATVLLLCAVVRMGMQDDVLTSSAAEHEH